MEKTRDRKQVRERKEEMQTRIKTGSNFKSFWGGTKERRRRPDV